MWLSVTYLRVPIKPFTTPVPSDSKISSQMTPPGKKVNAPSPLRIQTIAVRAKVIQKSWAVGRVR